MNRATPQLAPLVGLLFILAVALSAGRLFAAEQLPNDREATRRDIDARIDVFLKARHAPTLGLIKEVVQLSIAWGAPAYDDGDREGCYRFYSATIERLLRDFPLDEKSDPEVRAAFADLKLALESSQTYDDIVKKAWALRYGFDKVTLAWSRRNNHQQTLVGLGDKYFQLGLYTQALDACADATAELRCIAGVDVSELNLNARTAPLSCVRACFTLKNWKAAAGWLPVTLEFLPDLPTYPITPTQFYGDVADHARALKALEADFADQPDNDDLRLILAAEMFFLNRRERAQTLFRELLDKNKEHPVARAFLKTYPDSDYQQELAQVIRQLGAAKRSDRMQAFAQLQLAGRWAIPALRKAERGETNAVIGVQVRELLQRLGEKTETPLPRDQEY